MAVSVSPDYSVVARQSWHPMVPEGGVSGKAVLKDDGFMRFLWICEVVDFVVSCLSIGMCDFWHDCIRLKQELFWCL